MQPGAHNLGDRCRHIQILQILSAFSDGLFVSPAVVSASTFARKTEDAYFYHFNHSHKSGPYAAVSQSSK